MNLNDNNTSEGMLFSINVNVITQFGRSDIDMHTHSLLSVTVQMFPSADFVSHYLFLCILQLLLNTVIKRNIFIIIRN